MLLIDILFLKVLWAHPWSAAGAAKWTSDRVTSGFTAGRDVVVVWFALVWFALRGHMGTEDTRLVWRFE